MTGIYTITNLIDNKIYIGFSYNINTRFIDHKHNIKKNKHINNHLQQAINKYGIENFEFELLEECDKEFLCSQENYWANLLNVHNPKYGYNIQSTNPDCKCGNSIETRIKISKALLGKKRPEGVKNKISETRLLNGFSQKSKKAQQKKVLHIETGIIYDSRKQVCELFNINYATLGTRLRGQVFNDSGFEYLEKEKKMRNSYPLKDRAYQYLGKIKSINLKTEENLIFDSGLDAISYFNAIGIKIDSGSLSRCINRTRLSCHGYKFEKFDSKIRNIITQCNIRKQKLLRCNLK